MNQDYESAFAYIAALTQADPNTAIIDARAIHDTRKDIAAIPRRGTLPQLWNELCAWNSQGFGIFANINSMDGNGREIANVQTIRCNVIDLDNLSAQQNYERATQFNPPPSFAVQSSPGKFHVYWQTTYHRNHDGFSLLQRKLRTLYDGDKSVIDPTRIMRVPGFFHCKAEPHLVTCWALANYNNPINPSVLEAALAGVNVVDGSGGRHDLGDASLQAPGWDWCLKALAETDPNQLERGEWISFTSAWKQAAWNFAPEAQLFDVWSQWCARYTTDDPGENLKNWNSIRTTEVGWSSLERRNGNLHAMRLFGDKQLQQQQQTQQQQAPMPHEQQQPQSIPIPDGEFLTDREQKEWFKGCTFIERMGKILTPKGRYMGSTEFNGTYGGKYFIIDGVGKKTNEPWQAALRSTLYQIPKADHIRFLPSRPQGELIVDALGRAGVNTYKPAIIETMKGDVAPFLRHLSLLFPNVQDQQIIIEYLAHNARFPGYKIPWAPLIQSVQGVGKKAFKLVMQHAMGKLYTYEPKARELVESGSKFNAWMRSKLFIVVDEIKTDERRDMVEILKPMISEMEIEIQGKGVDQDIEDNPANWIFFSNHKDAIPIDKNDRRYAIFYSSLQSSDDLIRLGMNKQYFDWFYDWLGDEQNGGHRTGLKIIADYLLSYPIERGNIAMRAPVTSSTAEAVRQSRGPVEIAILDAIADNLPGFRGGWISSLAVANRLKGTATRGVSAKTLGTICEVLGYYHIGRAVRPYFNEHRDTRADLYAIDRNAHVEDYGKWQGYD